MDDAPEKKPVALPGLAMLDALRPPAGWVTEIALGTTYSLELPVALAAMVALSGTARETSEFGLHSAVRALHTLSGRVRILGQQGRIQAPPKRHRLVHLLDRVVRPIAFDERERSFHPKVWLVRWKPELDNDQTGRWVLFVGSRNLTSSQDWDLGVALEGAENAKDGKGDKLPRVAEFVSWLLGLAGETEFGAKVWDLLPTVRWTGPMKDLAFDFHGDGDIAWKKTALSQLAKDGARRVLLLSPFVDATALAEAERSLTVSRAWEKTARRFVLGRVDLERLKRQGSAADARGRIEDLRCLAPSLHGLSEVPEGTDESARSDDAPDPMDFGLHAKATLVWHGKNDVSVLLGSANLTGRGWTGKNAEAWVKLRGRTDAAESLWLWSAQYAAHFDATQVPTLTDEEETRLALEDAVDAIRLCVAATPMTLDDTEGRGVLRAVSPPYGEVLSPGGREVQRSLRVGRLGLSGAVVLWPEGSTSVELGACLPAERSGLVTFTLSATCGAQTVENTWVQSVSVTPAIDASRDDEAIAEALGPRQFMAYLNGLLDPGRDEGEGDPDDSHDGRGAGAATGYDDGQGLSLEQILRAFARRDPARMDLLREQLGRAIGSYRNAKQGKADDSALRPLFTAWSAIEKGLVDR